MDNNKPASKPVNAKKEFKKELETKIESALPEIKTKQGAKKFQRRIKKAAKILIQGLHKKDFTANNKEKKIGADKIKKSTNIKSDKLQPVAPVQNL
ncbi:MAG: hypothetical protein JO072_03940 [Parafilimonas sp.]|nr:hypothetical protein [Parafilimonas sp.]